MYLRASAAWLAERGRSTLPSRAKLSLYATSGADFSWLSLPYKISRWKETRQFPAVSLRGGTSYGAGGHVPLPPDIDAMGQN